MSGPSPLTRCPRPISTSSMRRGTSTSILSEASVCGHICKNRLRGQVSPGLFPLRRDSCRRGIFITMEVRPTRKDSRETSSRGEAAEESTGIARQLSSRSSRKEAGVSRHSSYSVSAPCRSTRRMRWRPNSGRALWGSSSL